MINYVPQASGLGADGSPDGALLQAMAARKKAQLSGLSGGQQLLQKASSSEPIYNKSLGYAKLIAGGLGGFLEGNEQRTQQEKAQALARQGATSAAGIAQSLGLSPDQARQLQGMYMANPEAASAIVKQMTERLFAKPDARFVDERLPDGSLAQRNAATNELAVRQKTDMLSPGAVEQKKDIATAGRAQTNVNVGGGSDKQFFDTLKESADSARTAVTGLSGLREARRAIQDGGYFGAGADIKLGLAKLAAPLGLGDPSKIVNTETFRSAIAPQVAALMKATVGSTQISNADREFAEKAAGGSINLDPASISRLLDIMERGSLVAIDRHQQTLNQVYPETPDGKFNRERAVFGVQPPAPPQPAPQPEVAVQPAPPPIAPPGAGVPVPPQQAQPDPAQGGGMPPLDLIEAEIQRRLAAQSQTQQAQPIPGTMDGF